MSSAQQVGGGLDVDAPVELAVAEVDPRRPCRSGSPAGSATRRRASVVPGGVDEVALADLGGGVDEVEQQVAGRADGGRDACPARGCRRRSPPAAKLWSVISVTTAPPPVTVLDLADEAGAVDHRVAAAGRRRSEPLLISMRWYQLLGECTIDARVDRAVLAHPAGVSISLSSRLLLGLAQALLRGRRAACGSVSRSAIGLVALVLGVERVAEPAEQVAERA